jgi:hypothetical protein
MDALLQKSVSQQKTSFFFSKSSCSATRKLHQCHFNTHSLNICTPRRAFLGLSHCFCYLSVEPTTPVFGHSKSAGVQRPANSLHAQRRRLNFLHKIATLISFLKYLSQDFTMQTSKPGLQVVGSPMSDSLQ